MIHDSGAKLHQVYDIAHGYYREQMKYTFPFVEEIVSDLHIGDYEAAFRTLVENQSAEARLCCELLMKYIIYSLNTAKELGCGMKAADDVMVTGFHWCPPLALVEAFGAVTCFEKLCKERLPGNILEVMKKNQVLKDLEKSSYDYRKFILAKR